MKKAENVKKFVEQYDAMKKVNPKDLSSDQDLTIAIMNLISIEEHLIFSGAKTGKTHFFDLIEQIREMRKNLMQKIIPSYEGEVWCISKHLLASAMRLMEVGTKQQSLKNTKDAYSLFNQAYDLYCLFWGLNMNLIDSKDLKWVEDSNYKEIAAKAQEVAAKVDTADIAPDVKPVEPAEQTAESADDAQATGFKKMKNFLRKAIDCCIE